MGGLRVSGLGHQRRFGILATLLLCCLAFLPPTPALAGEYTLGVVPQFPTRKMFSTWQPIVEELERRTGERITLGVPLTISDFERELERGKYDFVYAKPYHITRKLGKDGYQPLVRDKTPIRGLVVVPRNSPIKEPRDLNGKTLAVPSPNATGASMLVRAELASLYRVTMTLSEVRTHSAVYMNVAAGLVDAGGGVTKTFEEQDKTLRDKLRIVYTTREIPSHPVAAHSRVPAQVREAIRQAILDMAGTGTGRELLGEIPMHHPVPASADEYQALKKWRLESYWTGGDR